jgi:hypothetical protein
VHSGLLVQLRLHLMMAKPWQRGLVAIGLLAVGLATGVMLLVGLGSLLIVTTTVAWWRTGRGRRRQR